MFMQSEEEKKKKKTADNVKTAPGRLGRFFKTKEPKKYVEGEKEKEDKETKDKPVEPTPSFLERLLGKKKK